ncbi:hypothetical protein [Pseudomonas aeruginosa]|uniref:hypothetical protein n=1 Tax=Pseudomonas aeruginosa TaxID=287 RepID=UPI0038918B20
MTDMKSRNEVLVAKYLADETFRTDIPTAGRRLHVVVHRRVPDVGQTALGPSKYFSHQMLAHFAGMVSKAKYYLPQTFMRKTLKLTMHKKWLK